MNENLIEKPSSSLQERNGDHLDFAQDGRDYGDTISTKVQKMQVVEVPLRMSLPKSNGSQEN